jgi:GSH-dependent disulfide-bond oxidoreductase
VKFPADSPITPEWPPRHPDRIQVYSINSPNGVKASVMLEETGLPYEPHLVRFDQRDQHSPEFRSLNPYAKIPAIIDPLGPGGAPLALFESACSTSPIGVTSSSRHASRRATRRCNG